MTRKEFKKILSKYSVLAIITVVVIIALYIFNRYNSYKVADGEVEVHFIDVGQGDAALLLSDKGSVLIDTGTTESGEKVAAYVSSRTETIDYLVLSHPHEDHIGGAKAVFDSVTVKNVVMPDKTADSTSFDRLMDSIEGSDAKVIAAERGVNFSVGDADFVILSPIPGEDYEETNDVSTVVRVTYGGTSFMFTGDAEALVEKEILEEYSDIRCDVLKVGHHGSSTSSTEAFLKAVSPDIAVISCGKDNSYGHPHFEIIKRLENIGSNIYRTDMRGTVVITSDGKNVSVK